MARTLGPEMNLAVKLSSPGEGFMKNRLGSVLAALAMLVIAAVAVYPQGSDKNNPTVLKSRVIEGQAAYPLSKSGWAKTFYYVFTAGPGDIGVTVCTQSPGRPEGGSPGRPAGGWFEARFGGCTNSQFDHSPDDPHDARYAVTFNEYTVNHSHGQGASIGRQFVTVGLLAPKATERRAITRRFTLSKETTIIIAVNLEGRFDYRIQLDGPIISEDPR